MTRQCTSETSLAAALLSASPPLRRPQMGMAMGQDCELLTEVCGWINGAATKPVWAKMTPNVTEISQPARCAVAQVRLAPQPPGSAGKAAWWVGG